MSKIYPVSHTIPTWTVKATKLPGESGFDRKMAEIKNNEIKEAKASVEHKKEDSIKDANINQKPSRQANFDKSVIENMHSSAVIPAHDQVRAGADSCGNSLRSNEVDKSLSDISRESINTANLAKALRSDRERSHDPEDYRAKKLSEVDPLHAGFVSSSNATEPPKEFDVTKAMQRQFVKETKAKQAQATLAAKLLTDKNAERMADFNAKYKNRKASASDVALQDIKDKELRATNEARRSVEAQENYKPTVVTDVGRLKSAIDSFAKRTVEPEDTATANTKRAQNIHRDAKKNGITIDQIRSTKATASLVNKLADIPGPNTPKADKNKRSEK